MVASRKGSDRDLTSSYPRGIPAASLKRRTVEGLIGPVPTGPNVRGIPAASKRYSAGAWEYPD